MPNLLAASSKSTSIPASAASLTVAQSAYFFSSKTNDGTLHPLPKLSSAIHLTRVEFKVPAREAAVFEALMLCAETTGLTPQRMIL
ncbi:MAG: hypothetical protein LRY51_02350 [Geovibrio sp.]|nr:hypothetical protein [Geovibrio sp.]